jgi:transposase
VVTDISHEGLRKLLREEGVRFQALRTWKRSNDPDFERKKNRILELLAFCRYLRSLCPPKTRLHFVLDNFSPHLGEKVRAWAHTNNVELAYTPFYASWLNRIEAQFQALRYFCIAGTDHPDHATQARLIRRYIAWRNDHIDNPRLLELVRRANTANVA